MPEKYGPGFGKRYRPLPSPKWALLPMVVVANPGEKDGHTEPTDAHAVIAAETRYGRSLRQNIGLSVLVGGLIVGVQALLTWISSAGPQDRTPSLSPAALAGEDGFTALTVLLPVSIALQVLLRLPRDHESTAQDEAIAHRQLWGRIAGVVAMASAYVALSTFFDALIGSLSIMTVDIGKIAGVPLGLTIAMLFAADAATVADHQAERIDLAPVRSERTAEELNDAIRRIPGKVTPHPRRALIVQGMVVSAAATGAGSIVVQLIIGHRGATFVYAAVSALLTLFVLGVAVQVISSVVKLRILDTLTLLVPAGSLIVLFILESAFVAMHFDTGGDMRRYLIGLGFGFLVAMPSSVTVALLSIPRGSS